MRLHAETNGSMLFSAGEIDDDLWELEMEEGEDLPWNAKAEGDQREECVDGPEGLTLVDARNGFNELSRYAMLWTASAIGLLAPSQRYSTIEGEEACQL